jgi:pyruvate,water dikinase
LGELTTAGLPVPPGFVVTAAAYLDAVSESGARARITRLLGALNADDPISLADTQWAAREEIMDTPIPAEIANAIQDAYRTLGMMSPSRFDLQERLRMPVTAHSRG